ncbi:acyltransferase family protein [Kutzneria kofuensis]|uniref:Peptidoglycan/LPS O-acetylase OafA/YrhL n=1 Tax=Kutzneria kofuensis TaxID=103725 RepID=A0A7W9KEH7_9PSEU|nr:acyltransferase [Kutzneria kofuensis]MBB5891118.1 peptidoglycan/LPS O-acetylase OafA/YrhL [Kutzneria kofuensis]
MDSPARPRLAGLDGIRGLAALFVVLHHSYLMAFPGFPETHAPAWTGFLLYGHFAVVVFIVLSGFSLAVSPARNGWRLDSKAKFARRRAWRILPPYWPALLFSLVIAWTLAPQPGEGVPTGKSVVLYGLLLQDVFGSPSPNGAFWSIAVEAQLYFVFPLLLLALRRAGAAVMLGVATAIVMLIGLLAPHVSAVDALMRFTPQFAALFAAGVVAAGIVRAGEKWQRVRWQWWSFAAVVPVIALIVVMGPVWTTGNFIWVDLAASPAVALLLVAVATRQPKPLVRLLDTRPVRSLGSFSYSLYLTHAPIVVVVYTVVVGPLFGTGLGAFGVMLLICVPVTIAFARGFAAVFEIPFVKHRSWAALRAAMTTRTAKPKIEEPVPATD